MPPWVTTYWGFIFKYSWNISDKSLLKNLLKSLQNSSHYYVMVYIKHSLNIFHYKKHSSPFTSRFIVLKHWLQCFQSAFGYFHSLD
jgi:hypothetical protein